MQFDFNRNYFELFDLTPGFALDLTALEQAYRALQSQVHPDKFTHLSQAEQRASMQWSTRVNEAYLALKSPFNRALYLLQLQGIDALAERDTAMPADFLMQQMEWREALDDARGLEPLEELADTVQNSKEQVLHHCATLLDEQHDYAAAVNLVRILMFIEKFTHDLNQRLDQFE